MPGECDDRVSPRRRTRRRSGSASQAQRQRRAARLSGMQISSLSTEGGGNTRDERTDQHRQRGVDRSLGGCLAGGVSCLACLGLRCFCLCDGSVYTPLSIFRGDSRASGNQLGQIRSVCTRDVARNDSVGKDARRLGSSIRGSCTGVCPRGAKQHVYVVWRDDWAALRRIRGGTLCGCGGRAL